MSARSRTPAPWSRRLGLYGVLLAVALAAAAAATSPELDCLNNQKMIVSALWSYSLENKVPPDHTVLLVNLAPYFKNGQIPVCPLGGTYRAVLTVTREPLDVEKTPICSLGGFEQHLERALQQQHSPLAERARWLAVVVAVVILSPLLLAWRRRTGRAGEGSSDAGD